MIKITGGDKLRAKLEEISKNLKKGADLSVGFLENATYPDGTLVAMVAAIQEYGAPRARIPPRPFFRTMIAEKSGEWPAAIGGLLAEHNYDVEKVLNLAGAAIAGQLRQSIIAVQAPPLSPLTLMLRKMKSEGIEITGKSLAIARQRLDSGESVGGVATKPLVETGNLLQSIDWEVKSRA